MSARPCHLALQYLERLVRGLHGARYMNVIYGLTILLVYQLVGEVGVHFLLGPATVALAVPLYQQLSQLKRLWLPVLVTVVIAVLVGALSSIVIAGLMGATALTQISLAPKSVTAPVAMGISDQLGGLPSLTAVLVVATGILGAVLGAGLFSLLRIRDDSVKGIAMGVTAHGIGTARAFQVSPRMGAFSGLAMALSALFSAALLPGLLDWLRL